MPVLTILLAWLLLVTLLGVSLVLVSHPADSARITIRPPKPEPPTAWLEEVTARRMIIHTTDDRSIEGLLTHVEDKGMVLSHAKLLGDKPVDLGGEIWIDRPKVLLVQTVP